MKKISKPLSILTVLIVLVLMILGLNFMESLHWSGTSIFIGSCLEFGSLMFVLLLLLDDGELFS